MSIELDKLTSAVQKSKEAEDVAIASLIDNAEHTVEVKDDPVAVTKLAEHSVKIMVSLSARQSKMVEMAEVLASLDTEVKKEAQPVVHRTKTGKAK